MRILLVALVLSLAGCADCGRQNYLSCKMNGQESFRYPDTGFTSKEIWLDDKIVHIGEHEGSYTLRPGELCAVYDAPEKKEN